METNYLNHNNALSTYADLWIIPDFSISKWAKQIDYYLNFLILRSQKKSKSEFDPKLKTILANEKITASFDSVNSHLPLMVAAQKELPAKQIVYLGNLLESDKYLEEVKNVISGLKAQSVKIFLADNMKVSNIGKTLPDDLNAVIFLVESLAKTI